MPSSDIVVKGAREHNLRDVDLVLPRNQLICLTGVSGSGKSSLAFDTIYAEGQRRYVESLSSYARHLLGQMPKPDVDFLGGLSPSISISQKSTGHNPRSTVGTVTEIYDYLRVLFARVGDGFCPKCQRPISSQSREEIVQRILSLEPGMKFTILAPLIRGQKGEHRDLFESLLKQGFARARVDGQMVALTDSLSLDRQMRHDIEVAIDRLAVRPDMRTRIAESVELGIRLGKGTLIVAPDSAETSTVRRPDEEFEESEDEEESTSAKARTKTVTKTAKKRGPKNPGDIVFSVDYACTHCNLSFEPPSPQLFSFNSPQGMCPNCAGLGYAFTFAPDLLIPDSSLSFKDGAVELIGTWKDLGRWRRHIYQGVADTMERKLDLEAGTLLETPWKKLKPSQKAIWLEGTGDEHVTFTWKGGNSPMKYGGRWDGIVPELLDKYRETKSGPHIKALEKYMSTVPCSVCDGERLLPQARAVKITTQHADFADKPIKTLPEVCHLSILDAEKFFSELVLSPTRTLIATEVLKEIRSRLGFLLNVGLEYLTLDRGAPTLSGGETQRIRLASQIGSGLVGVLYILDEPSIGLHPRDNDRLLSTLHRLRDMGNTVVVVEHDEDTMWAADHIVDFGPGPGVRGGQMVAHGKPQIVADSKTSVTGAYLSGRRKIAIPEVRRPVSDKWLKVIGAKHHNLRNVDVEIPLGVFVCVTGVSGSGKSSVVNDILVETLRRDLNGGEGEPGAHDRIEGMEHLDKLIAIDQTPIGRTPRSNPGTYIKLFDDIRDLFAELPEAKRRGFKPGRFSFNVEGGRCEACEGNGSNKLEMEFLADVWVTCTVCEGKRFSRETLQVRFKGKSIADVLDMDVQQALELFENVPNIRHKLQTLHDVGLDYLKIGQPSPTLSGGEAQRIKLARELAKRSTGKTLYLLDEPTTGLHFADIELLLKVLHRFCDEGNTVLVVEHNLDVIKTADWVVDLGPEGGQGGGQLVVAGTPETVAKCRQSHTGKSLVPVLEGRAAEVAREKAKQTIAAHQSAKKNGKHREGLLTHVDVRGAKQHNLKEVSCRIPRDAMTVFCGPSGSGKSSLAMDTIYAEGQRRYVESLSAYARQFVAQMQKPAVESIEGLSPAIAIEQKNLGNTPRSTVGTVTEVYDYLRIMMARLGQPYCPACDKPVGTQTPDEITDKILSEPEGTKLYIAAPLEVENSGPPQQLWEELKQRGYARVRVNGTTFALEDAPAVDRRRKQKIEIVLDRISVSQAARSRIAGSVESALSLGKGVLHVVKVHDTVPEPKWETIVHSQHMVCGSCGRSFEPLSPHNFSFNSQLGWCSTCEGLGTQTGANPAALLRDPKLTLADGALAIWPQLSLPIARSMLEGLSEGTGIPLDVPFEQLAARYRRVILHGTGDQWFAAKAVLGDSKPLASESQAPVATTATRKKAAKKKSAEAKPAAPREVSFQFQFKGLYPSLEEASRLSPQLRMRLDQFIGEVECGTCAGSRLRDDSSSVRFRDKTIDEICRLPMGELQKMIEGWTLTDRERKVAGELLREIMGRVEFLNDVGLEYLSLARPAATLSNGEAQRIRLASQLGSGLCGVLYVLDEPTIGLHPRDNTKLLKAMHKLRDLGNTLLVVEHDREVIENCDELLDFGPGAGKLGGQIVASGTPKEVATQPTSITGPFLSGEESIPVIKNRRDPLRKLGSNQSWPYLSVVNARHNNLKNVNVDLPLGTFTAITGPSGSGKSTLIEDVLYAALARSLHRAAVHPGVHDRIDGLEHINKVIRVDQQPLGNSPASNPATYTGAFELIRDLFSQLPDSKLRGYNARRFSFNVAGGRCEACEGYGQKRIEMHFLADVWVECETCRGQRYTPETLAVKFHGHSISEVLNSTCGEALRLFENIPKIRRVLQTLCDVGLDYLTLGQPAPTLSGGEAQRVKLAAELARPDTGRTLYLLDEPTTGLHFEDISKLLEVLQRLVDLGNTVVVIEHNLDVIKTCDWVIDLGPEAGDGGGRIVVAGTPETVVAHADAALRQLRGGPRKKVAAGKAESGSNGDGTPTLYRSYTGEALKPVLEAGPFVERKAYDPFAEERPKEGDLDIADVGSTTQMPWEVDGRRWHTQDRVGRKGEECRWDGRILAEVIDRIQAAGDFAETNYNARSVVEITGQTKSEGWFFHAITGEAWLLKMKFRVYRGTFKGSDLQDRIPLKTLNQLEELPLYGNEPRLKVKSTQGPFQEVEIRAHSYEEINVPGFWSFIDEAVAGFFKFTEKASVAKETLAPWKVLGQKWHFLRKGFPPGKKVAWSADTLEELFDVLTDLCDGQLLWNNQQVVHLIPKGRREPWASIWTKRPQSVMLCLSGPKGKFGFGRVVEFGKEPALDEEKDRDVIKLQFASVEQLHQPGVKEFLVEHLQAVVTNK
jgi:excinuclease ABC subunit A